MALKVACAGLLVAVAEAKPRKKVSWRLGEERQNCDEVCSDVGMFCNPHDWPTSSLQLLQTSIPAKITCKYLLDERVRFAPYVRDLEKGECVYDSTAAVAPAASWLSEPSRPPMDAAAPSCKEAPVGHSQRICPCGSSAPTFYVADDGESCTQFCEDRGGSCNTDRESRSLKNTRDLEEVAKTLGFSCQKLAAVGTQPFYAPAIKEDECEYPPDSLFTDCNAQAKGHRRICQCIGASTQKVTEVATTVRYGTCSSEDGFKSGEGTGGKEKRQVGTAANKGECLEKVKKSCKDANGATFVTTDHTCWAEIGMTGYQFTGNTQVCWFSDGAMGGGLWSMLAPEAGISAASAGVAALAAVAFVAGAAIVARRRSASHDFDADVAEGLVTEQ